MRRRGPGVGGLKKRAEVRNAMREKGAELQEDRLQHSQEVLETFRKHLEQFAVKYRESIKSDPYFRAQFQKMCEKIGVDPLASSKGLWGELLGLGDFYYELGVQIIEVCIRTRPHNGGIIGVHELLQRLKSRSKHRAETSVDDVVRSVGKLKRLGSGFGILRVGRQRQIMVVSVPLELDRDQSAVLDLAAHPPGAEEGGGSEVGCVTIADLTGGSVGGAGAGGGGGSGGGGGLGWSEARAKRALATLLRSGTAWVDGEGPTAKFWFLSVWLDARVETGVESNLNDDDDDGGGNGSGGGGGEGGSTTAAAAAAGHQ